MVNEKKKKTKTFAFMLVLGLMVLFTFQMNRVSANIPEIVSIEYYESGENTTVRLDVRHSSNDYSYHYVDKAIFEIEGVEEEVALEPQSTEDFFVEYNLGEVTGTPSVRARVECTVHFLSIWSEQIVIPEFPTLSLLLIFATASIAVPLFRSKLCAQ